MQHKLARFAKDFQVLIGNARSQCAEMTLPPGETEGGPDNSHRGADQWLFIVSGRGVAVIDGKRINLKAAKVVLIERGEAHEIRNTGTTPLKTISFYVPPAYNESGDELPRGRS